MAKRPRLTDVAKLAGVSQATVSVVLNNRVGESARVSIETQEKIWEAVRALGYVANPLARSLAGGRNHIIAVFTFEPVFPIEYQNFYYPFLIGIEEQAAHQGYELLLLTSDPDGLGKRNIYRDGINRLKIADGAVLLGFENKHEVRALLDENYPFVFVGRRESPNNDISYVAADYCTATADIVRYLFRHGHTHIAYLRSASDSESTRDREEGYLLVHRHHNRMPKPELKWHGDADELTVDEITRLIGEGATAFVAENDELATALLDLAGTLGLHCPQDFSLAVLGDPLSLTHQAHDWTTFKVPRREMGNEAVRLLVRLLDDPEARQQVPLRSTLQCTFVPGSTVGVPQHT